MKDFYVDSSYIGIPIDWQKYQDKVSQIHDMIMNKTGLGNEYCGWVDWPSNVKQQEVDKIKQCAERIKKQSDVLLVCGVGGSYLGARAGIEMINGHYDKNNIEIIFIGNTFSSTEITRILAYCKGKRVSCNVISKSGQTTETAIAFRIIRKYLEAEYGLEESIKRIIITTDKNKGLLRPLVRKMGYESFEIPDDIGGRFSVITPVGLFPMAVAGIDINAFIQGLKDSSKRYQMNDLNHNDAYKYALLRNIYSQKGYISEMFVSYEPQMSSFSEWLKQLFGESEGKQGKGLLPHAVTNTTDLHSMGQFIQQGTKCLFETILCIDQPLEDMTLPQDEEDDDGLNYLADKSIDWMNKQAYLGTLNAHVQQGNVANIVIHIPCCNAYNFGYLVYFYFQVLAMSAYLLGVNPFDQPGVEIYKRNMYHLLGKPGY